LILVAVIVVITGIVGAVYYRYYYLPHVSPVQVCGTSGGSDFVLIWSGTTTNTGSIHYSLLEEISSNYNYNYFWVSNHSYSPGTVLYLTNLEPFNDQPSNPLMATVSQPSSGSCYNVGLVAGIH
jgi:hypothetical protein